MKLKEAMKQYESPWLEISQSFGDVICASDSNGVAIDIYGDVNWREE